MAILADESHIKKHPLYAAAKGGDVEAAQGLVLDTVTVAAIEKICDVIGDSEPFLIPVHAVESEGRNPIPLVLAQMLSQTLNLPLDVNVIQINTVGIRGRTVIRGLLFPLYLMAKCKPANIFW